MPTASVTTKIVDSKETRILGPDLYYEVKAWFVRRRRTLNGFLTGKGYSLREGRDALTGANQSERAKKILTLVTKETRIPIEEES